MKITRRNLIYTSLFGAGLVGLRSLATGLPRGLLLDPLAARAEDAPPARTLILATSQAGDPINGNVPGTYGAGLDDLVHPQDPRMAETALTLGGRRTTAAKPWADLDQGILDRTVFIHHSTYANSHPAHPKVMRLMGQTNRSEMLVSVYAKALAPRLATIQAEPISLGARGGSELLSFEGRTLSKVSPTALRTVLAGTDGPLADLQGLRDRDIDRIYALYKSEGTENQRRMLDRFAQTRDEARAVSESLLTRLAAVDGDDAVNQVRTAPIVAAMGVAPVITVRIPFGGDNHRDTNLVRETEETITGVAALGELVAQADALRLEGVLRHDVVVGSLNVFGRTMSLGRKGYGGRDHNARHHVTVLIGDAFRAGVIGGVTRANRDWGAMPIDSATGEGAPDGDIAYEDTFACVAKTLGTALGVPQPTLDEDITAGRVLDVMLN